MAPNGHHPWRHPVALAVACITLEIALAASPCSPEALAAAASKQVRCTSGEHTGAILGFGIGGRLAKGERLVPKCDGEIKFEASVRDDGDFVILEKRGDQGNWLSWQASNEIAPGFTRYRVPYGQDVTLPQPGLDTAAKRGLFFWLHALNKRVQKYGWWSLLGMHTSEEGDKPLTADGLFRPASRLALSRSNGTACLLLEPDRLAMVVDEHVTWAANLSGPPGELKMLENGEISVGSAHDLDSRSSARTLKDSDTPLPIRTVDGYHCLDYHPDQKHVWVHSCHGRANQRWIFHQGKSLQTEHDDHCLDLNETMKPAVLNDGVAIVKDPNRVEAVMKPCVDKGSQRWFADDIGRIRSDKGDQGLCLELLGHGDAVHATTCHEGKSQRWTRGSPAWLSSWKAEPPPKPEEPSTGGRSNEL